MIQKVVTRLHQIFGEEFHRGLFLVGVHRKPVHDGILAEGLYKIQSRPVVGSLDRANQLRGEDHPIGGELSVKGFANVKTHLGKPFADIVS